MIYDTFRECEGDELLATKRLLNNYYEQNVAMKAEQTELKRKLSNVQEQMATQTISQWVPGLPVIYMVTPTYARPEQKAELTRISYTLKLVKNIHWIIVEDSYEKTKLVTNFLKQTGLNFTHLYVATPKEVKLKDKDPNWLKPRGVLQRNEALSWLRIHTHPDKLPGVLFFADDDNTYSLQLFAEMRHTIKVSVWPVGLVGYLRYESPIVKDEKVTGWFTYWRPERPFAIDMAGFAVNLRLLHLHPDAGFSNKVQRGFQESNFLSGVGVTLNDLEPKANMCTEVLVWHTRTEKSRLTNEDKMQKKFGMKSDPNIEV